MQFINWYVAKLYRAAQNDPALATAFLEVANFRHPPEALFRPGIIWRVGREIGQCLESMGWRKQAETLPAALSILSIRSSRLC